MKRTKKPDVIVEAVRYAPDGRIQFVRAYERHGVVWSDCLLLDRHALLERLKSGKNVFIGRRTSYLGNTFEIGVPLRIHGQAITLADQPSSPDNLAGVPLL